MQHPRFGELISLALERLLCTVKPDENATPLKIFPLPKTLRCSSTDWTEFGDLHNEQAKLERFFSTIHQRNVPRSCESVLQRLLDQENVLTSWKQVFTKMMKAGNEEIDAIARRLQRGHLLAPIRKSDLVAIPIDYQFDSPSTTALRLWNRSLKEAGLQIKAGRKENLLSFLQIHSFLKDPISGLRKNFQQQHTVFLQLLAAVEESQPINHLSSHAISQLAAQAAQESSFLSIPLLENLICVARQDNLQLPYVRVQLSELGRAEFSLPEHVLEVAEEMLAMTRAHERHVCLVVPILVASCPGFLPGGDPLVSIIDGNHRATAAVFLRFLADYELGEDHGLMSKLLLRHCEAQGFGRKWQIDLLDVLDRLYGASGLHFHDVLASQQELVKKFAHVTHIPALVVQEEDFLTICKQRSVGQPSPVLLQPFHQTIFNDDDLKLALPQKAGQTHGRPDVFRLLPLEPFETGGYNYDLDVGLDTSLLLRKSLVGLPSEQVNR